MILFGSCLESCFSCVCSVFDHEFRHNIVKVAVDPRSDSRMDPQTTLTIYMTKFMINNRTDARKTDVNFFLR